MNCPECQFENIEGSRFCNECGCNLPSISYPTRPTFSFDEKIEKIQRYLPEGLTEKILNQKDKIEGERKQVTVMFCDMEGFTSLVEMLGPEEAYQIMDQVYEILINSVHDFEGTVNEMTGDGIMALFGAPIALEEAPQRALWSAISIHRDISRFSAQKRGIGAIRMRIGIHTGPVIVGTLGNDLRVEFKAVGNTVNLASRMEKIAEAGSTYVTGDTFKQTKGLFRFETVGKKSVRGQKESIFVYKVLSAKEHVYRPRLGSERMIYSEMVGRDKELKRLELQVMKVINAEGSVINIIGEAGIGKSRLVAELKKHDAIKRVTLLECRAIAIGKNLSFHPIIDLLKQWARIKKDDGEAMAFGKLEAAVRDLYPAAFSEVLPFLGILMGMKPSGRYAERIKGIEGEALEKLILKNIRELLIRATELTPLVIVIEDLQWADKSSIGLLESLFRLAKTHRVLFINVFRPGYKETGDRILKTVKERLPVCYNEIMLKPLDEQLREVLITNILKISDLHHAFFRKIAQRTGGNPFFIEEVVRSLIDEHAVILKDGSFELTDKIDSVSIPNTINEVLMFRIDQLDEKTRIIVKVASVIGRHLFYKVLQDVIKQNEDIDARLSYLKEIQLFRERRKMGEVEYIFKHALAQKATYESILPRKRRELHLKVADSIVRVFGERLHEFYGMLAYHYSRAENLKKTEEYLIKAGEEGLKSSASAEALYFFRKALTLYPRLSKNQKKQDTDKLVMLEKSIALAFFNKGQYADALTHMDKALEILDIKFPKDMFTSLFFFVFDFVDLIVNLYFPLKRKKRIPTEVDHEVFNLIEKKLICLGFLKPKLYIFQYLRIIGLANRSDITKIRNGPARLSGTSAIFSWTGFSFKLSKKILLHYKKLINHDDIKENLNYKLYELYYNFFVGNWSDYTELDDALIEENLKKGQIWHVSTYIFFCCSIAINQGKLNSTNMLINKLSEIWEIYENENTKQYLYSLKIKLLVKSRRFSEAKKEIDEGISFVSKAENELAFAYYMGFKAITQVLSEELKAAEETLCQANEILSKEAYYIPHYMSSYLKANFLYNIYKLEKAQLSKAELEIKHYKKRALKSSQRAFNNCKKYAADRTEIYRLLGTFKWITNNQTEAIKWWKKCISQGELIGDRIETARTYMEIGARLSEKSSTQPYMDGIKSEVYLEKAKQMFMHLNLAWDVKEIEKFLPV